MLSLSNQGKTVYGAQAISFRAFFKKGIVSYTLFITTASPSRALEFVFICLFFCWLLSCSCSVYNILLCNGTFYSIGSCLEVPEPTKQQCWGSWGVIWGAEKGRIPQPCYSQLELCSSSAVLSSKNNLLIVPKC